MISRRNKEIKKQNYPKLYFITTGSTLEVLHFSCSLEVRGIKTERLRKVLIDLTGIIRVEHYVGMNRGRRGRDILST